MAESLITQHIDLWTSAIEAKSTAGRGSKNKFDLYGIKKLRELILELAVRGKLVPQDPNDEPASILLDKINKEKNKLIQENKLKKSGKNTNTPENEEAIDLPNGWKLTKLIDVYDVRDGTHDTPKYTQEGYPLITSKNLYTGKLDFSDIKFISELDHLKISERSRVDRNDILFAMIGSIGNPTIVDVETEFSIKNVALFKYYKYELSAPHYLKYYLICAADKLKSKSAGGVQPFVSLGTLRDFIFPLPPLEEQHRIVAKVDELMALCDQLEQQTLTSIDAHATLVETLLETLTNSADAAELEQNWARISEHFDTLFTTEQSIDALKQTILQLAVMGKLVRQDPTDEPASVLLEKIAAEKAQLIKDKKIKKEKPLPPISDDEKPFELPQGWEWCRLANFADVGTGATPSRANSSYWQPEEFSWVSSGETGELFVTKTKEKISRLAVKETNVSIYPVGTLIVAMYGQGKTRGQITELLIEAGTNQACAAIRLINENESHKKYIKLFFLKAYEEIRSFAAGGAQPNLNVGKISTTVIPIPPLNEQKRIVAKVDLLMLLCEQLKNRLQESCKIQLHLTNSIVMQGVEI